MFEWLLPLSGFGATKSGVDFRILYSIIVAPMLMFVAWGPSITVSGFGSAGVAGTIASTSQPAIFAYTKAGHKCSKSCHSLRLFLTKVSGEPFIIDALFKCRQGFSIRTVDDLVLFN